MHGQDAVGRALRTEDALIEMKLSGAPLQRWTECRQGGLGEGSQGFQADVAFASGEGDVRAEWKRGGRGGWIAGRYVLCEGGLEGGKFVREIDTGVENALCREKAEALHAQVGLLATELMEGFDQERKLGAIDVAEEAQCEVPLLGGGPAESVGRHGEPETEG